MTHTALGEHSTNINSTDINSANGNSFSDKMASTVQPVISDAGASIELDAAHRRIAPTDSLGWSVLKNSVAQVASRILIAAVRLLVAGIIIRSYGKDLFGMYSLVFGILAITDWLVDFGTTEVYVREVCREPERRERLLRILTAVKIIQIPVAFLLLTGFIIALGYPLEIIEAGIIGGLNVLFFGGVLVYRVLFKATLTMEREAAAELLSVLAIVPLVVLVCAYGGGLAALVGCHVISRAVFFGACFLFGKNRFALSVRGVTREEIRWSFRSCAAIGAVGFLVGGYETLDILLLSKLGSFSELAYYSSAQRLVLPLLMVLTAIAATFYPIIASVYPHAQEQFEATCQRALDTVLIFAGFGLCSVLAGAEFFMGILDPELVSGAGALRVFAILCFVKAITSTLGPVLYILKRQKQALQFIAIATGVKAVVVAALIPRYGYMGVAYGSLAIETCFAAVPAMILLRRYAGFHLRWFVPSKVALITLAAAGAPLLFISVGSFAAAAVAPIVYVPLLFMSGVVRASELRLLLRARKA